MIGMRRRLKCRRIPGCSFFILAYWKTLGLDRLHGLNRELNFFLQLLFQTPVQFWVGWQFYSGAWKSAKYKSADMNTLIAVGTSAAYLYSVLAMFFPHLLSAEELMAEVYFDTAGAIVGPLVIMFLDYFLNEKHSISGRNSPIRI